MNIFSIICHYGSPVRTLCLNLRSAKVTYTSFHGIIVTLIICSMTAITLVKLMFMQL